jgi:hypothetical protein
MPMRVAHLAPPPDCPKISTRFGSPPELGNVVPNPLERENEIQHSGIAGVRQIGSNVGEIEIAEEVEAVIQGNENYIAMNGKDSAPS